MRLVDFISSLYPANIGDGRDEARKAVEKLTRTVPGRTPEAVRLGRIFGANKNKPLPGSLQLKSLAFDMVRNCALWTALGEPGAAAPVLSGTETAAPVPKVRRHVEDDTPACRERVERFIGTWLVDHREDLPGAPAEFGAIDRRGRRVDLALYNDRFTLVTLREGTWWRSPFFACPRRTGRGLPRRRRAAPRFTSRMCNDEPGYMSFNASGLPRPEPHDRGRRR